jgi:Protein of unknown function (DUF4242)
MSVVLVERAFPQPVAFEDIQAIEDRGAGCLEAHGVRFLRSYFSRDRRRMICLYEAPDADSVRLAQEKAGVPFEKAWTARIVRHRADEPDGQAILVERTLPKPLDEAAIRDAAVRGAWCLEERGCRSLRSYLSSDGHRVVCVFAGPDAESVREAQKQIGMPFDGAWPATVVEKGGVAPERPAESLP